MSLHAVVLIFAGISREGGSSSRAINIEPDGAVRQHVKLINPQAAVDQVLEAAGLKQFFEVHTTGNRDHVLLSFPHLSYHIQHGRVRQLIGAASERRKK